MKIGVVDIGSGNLYNLIKCIKELEVNLSLVNDLSELKQSDALIIPGVGAYKSGIETLQKSNIVEGLKNFAFQKKPILGICLGMQLLLGKSYEFGVHEGLNLISGTVRPIKEQTGWPIPNIGWCNVKIRNNVEQPFNNISDDNSFYFIHSYYCDVDEENDIIGIIDYGNFQIPAIIQNENIMGCQFHPELSDNSGFQILNNFVKLIRN
ncbi:MAG: imidazole glycerol phosphate synthase subunit HisH [Rhodospirillaceae bacterium]|nr:imidazole glycerol phosphate synthase subunit HisH [Rhodospirillaceae bacterium]|tara:strand:+ start:3557 stop:4180 length:624 start_codon:yes stop_codon:yes gene_type:complete